MSKYRYCNVCYSLKECPTQQEMPHFVCIECDPAHSVYRSKLKPIRTLLEYTEETE